MHRFILVALSGLLTAMMLLTSSTAAALLLPKCRTILNPYQIADEVSKASKKSPKSRRLRLATLTPSHIASEYNNKRASIITDKDTKKSYLFDVGANNVLYLRPTEPYIAKLRFTIPRCTFRLNVDTVDPAYIAKLKASGSNTNIRISRMVKMKPSQIPSLFNGRRSTVLVDFGAKKYYLFMLDKDSNLSLQQITRDGVFIEKAIEQSDDIIEKVIEKSESEDVNIEIDIKTDGEVDININKTKIPSTSPRGRR